MMTDENDSDVAQLQVKLHEAEERVVALRKELLKVKSNSTNPNSGIKIDLTNKSITYQTKHNSKVDKHDCTVSNANQTVKPCSPTPGPSKEPDSVNRINRSKGDHCVKERSTNSKGHVCPPPQISNINDINVTDIGDNLHLGTNMILNGPVNIIGLKLQDIVSINGHLNVKSRKFDRKRYLKEKKKDLTVDKPKKDILKTLTLKKCLLIALFFFVVQGVGLFLISKYNTGPNTETHKEICVEKLNEMNLKLTKFVRRKNWGFDHNCKYSVYLENNVKTKIKFTVVHPNLWMYFLKNDYTKSVLCDSECNREYTKYAKMGLHDIYYNYMVSFSGHIFEGRPLNCFFEKEEETVLSEDLTEIIVVGLPYCFSDGTMHRLNYTIRIGGAIFQLTESLIKTGLLVENFSIEFPDACKNSTLVKVILSKHPGIAYFNNTYDFFNNTKLSQKFKFRTK